MNWTQPRHRRALRRPATMSVRGLGPVSSPCASPDDFEDEKTNGFFFLLT